MIRTKDTLRVRRAATSYKYTNQSNNVGDTLENRNFSKYFDIFLKMPGYFVVLWPNILVHIFKELTTL